MNKTNNNALFVGMASALIVVFAICYSKDKENEKTFFERQVTHTQTTKNVTSKQLLLGHLPKPELTEADILANEAKYIEANTPKLSKAELHRYLKAARVNALEASANTLRSRLPGCTIYNSDNNSRVNGDYLANDVEAQLHQEACRIYKDRFNESLIAHIAENADALRDEFMKASL